MCNAVNQDSLRQIMLRKTIYRRTAFKVIEKQKKKENISENNVSKHLGINK